MPKPVIVDFSKDKNIFCPATPLPLNPISLDGLGGNFYLSFIELAHVINSLEDHLDYSPLNIDNKTKVQLLLNRLYAFRADLGANHA